MRRPARRSSFGSWSKWTSSSRPVRSARSALDVHLRLRSTCIPSSIAGATGAGDLRPVDHGVVHERPKIDSPSLGPRPDLLRWRGTTCPRYRPVGGLHDGETSYGRPEISSSTSGTPSLIRGRSRSVCEFVASGTRARLPLVRRLRCSAADRALRTQVSPRAPADARSARPSAGASRTGRETLGPAAPASGFTMNMCASAGLTRRGRRDPLWRSPPASRSALASASRVAATGRRRTRRPDTPVSARPPSG